MNSIKNKQNKLSFSIELLLAVTLSIFCISASSAAGPLNIFCGPNDQIEPDCFATYPQNNPVLTYVIDPGAIGSDISETEKINLVNSTLDIWNDVIGSDFRFEQDSPGVFDNNITVDDIEEFFGDNSGPFGFSPIIFDDNGDIVAALGLGRNSVLGFAGPSFADNNGDIIESQATMNDFLFAAATSPIGNKANRLATLASTIQHELGHAIALDHTAVHTDAFDAISRVLPGAPKNNSLPNPPANFTSKVPIMFPIAVNPGTDLTADDIAALIDLYPNNTGNTQFGKIAGIVVKASGGSFNGTHITAHKIDDPFDTAISSVSGKLTDFGDFTIEGVPPGTYKLRQEAINPTFINGSSVGPHDPANNVVDGYYNGNGNGLVPNFDDVGDAGLITVAAGGTVTGITIQNVVGDPADGDNNDDDDDDDDDDIDNDLFDADEATLKAKQKRNGDIKVKIKVPKLIKQSMVFNVSTSAQFAAFIDFKKTTIKSRKKQGKFTIKFVILPGLPLDQNGQAEIPIFIDELSTPENPDAEITTILTVGN